MEYWLGLGDQLVKNIVGFNPSWTQLVLVFGLIAVFLFRKNLSSLIERASRIGPSGIDFHKPQIPPPPTAQELGKIRNTFSNVTSLPTIEQNQIVIRQHLSNQKIIDPAQAENFLTRELADVYFILRCERIYWIIFGSQIQLLKKLLATQSNGLSQQDINQHFEEISKIYPEFFEKWNTDLYLNFLIQSNLVIKQNNRYSITTFGADFLTWLQRSGFPENRPF